LRELAQYAENLNKAEFAVKVVGRIVVNAIYDVMYWGD
jgi:hypothetical protein